MRSASLTENSRATIKRKTSLVPASALIIDHSCCEDARIPNGILLRAQRLFRVAYGHTSHGSQIVSGMEALRQHDPVRYAFSKIENQGLSLLDNTPPGDLGNPDRTTWAERTRKLLRGEGCDRNLVMWSWCGQVGRSVSQEIHTYLNLMAELEQEFPSVIFVYMTGHLDGTGRNGVLNQRNEQIREFCRKNDKILFDFADIESYDPDGKTNYMELQASDSCDYIENSLRRNWADDWLASNPGHKRHLPESAAHSHPLNAALKGAAFWWLLAELAGWKPGK